MRKPRVVLASACANYRGKDRQRWPRFNSKYSSPKDAASSRPFDSVDC